MIKATDGCCEEAALNAPEGMYLPCNKPAEWIVGWKGRSDKPIRMCFACKEHNVRNRGGEVIEKMTISEFAWHAAALKGERGPIHDGEPQSGFYRQKNRLGLYEPVAYWKDSATGEQRCHINGHSPDIDRMMHTWPFASKNPITAEAYWHRIDTGQWADNDAGAAAVARGPEIDPATDPVGSLKAEIDAAKAGIATYATIDSDEQSARAQTLRSALTALSGKATKAYEALNRPLLDEQVRIRKVWFPLRDEAATAADAIRKAMTEWEKVKLANKRRADEEAAKIAAEQAKAFNEATAKAAAANEPPPEPPKPAPVVASNVPPPSTKIKGASGRAASVQLKKVVTAIDIDKAFAQFRDEPELYALLLDLSQKVVTAGFTAIGATIEEKSDIR